MKFLLLNGPNLNMLGRRNPDIYGTITLKELEQQCIQYAQSKGIAIECQQSNSEGQLIDILYNSSCDGVVLNAGALTHYGLSLRDCIECLPMPVVQAHLSDITNREDFRKVNVLSDVTVGNCYGKGVASYYEAIDLLSSYIEGHRL